MAKNKYADDYETVETQDPNGNPKQTTIYRGEYFELGLDDSGLRSFKRASLLLIAAVTAVHIGAGFVGNRGMYQFFIALPYVFAYLPLYFLSEGALRLPNEARKLRRDEVGRSVERMKTWSFALLVLLVMGLLGEAAFIMLAFENAVPGLETLFVGLELLAALAALALVRRQGRIRVEKSGENPVVDPEP